MSIEGVLADICKDLRMLGDDELTQKAIFAYAAVTDTNDPHPDLSYSYIVRKLRKGDADRRLKFQKAFKEAFDAGLYEDVEDPSALALIVAMKAIDYKEKDA
jgi:hypothetical protein